jgi:hypothetical protein
MSTENPGISVKCDYCGSPASLVPDSYLYGRSYGRNIWACWACDAYVGTHPDNTPLGRLANKSLRHAKMMAHANFDPIWKTAIAVKNMKKSEARRLAYKWLAANMGLSRDECHIGMFDIDQCKQVIAICSPVLERWRQKGYRLGVTVPSLHIED